MNGDGQLSGNPWAEAPLGHNRVPATGHERCTVPAWWGWWKGGRNGLLGVMQHGSCYKLAVKGVKQNKPQAD